MVLRGRARDQAAQISQLTRALQQTQAVVSQQQSQMSSPLDSTAGDDLDAGEESGAAHTRGNSAISVGAGMGSAGAASVLGLMVSTEQKQQQKEAMERLQGQVKSLEEAAVAKENKIKAGRAR